MSAPRYGRRGLPVLLTRAEVLEHFANECEQMAHAMSTASRLADSKAFDDDPLLKALIDIGKAALPAADLQIAAAKDAAKLMRDLATEERILAARAAADAANKEPSRG